MTVISTVRYYCLCIHCFHVTNTLYAYKVCLLTLWVSSFMKYSILSISLTSDVGCVMVVEIENLSGKSSSIPAGGVCVPTSALRKGTNPSLFLTATDKIRQSRFSSFGWSTSLRERQL